MFKKTIVVLSFLGLLGMSMSIGLIGCIEQSGKKPEFPPESELDQDDDPYPDEYLQDQYNPVPKKRLKATPH